MFAQSNIFMAENLARRLVTQFVDQALFASKMHVNEANASQEASITTPRFSEDEADELVRGRADHLISFGRDDQDIA